MSMPESDAKESSSIQSSCNPDGKSSIQYRVPYADTDQMAFVYYANYLVYFERLRNELLRETGIEYRQIEGEGIFFPVVEAYVEYHLPAHYDDMLQITGWVVWAKGSRFRIDYEILRNAERLTTGYTMHATINREGMPRRVPKNVLEAVVAEQSR